MEYCLSLTAVSVSARSRVRGNWRAGLCFNSPTACGTHGRVAVFGCREQTILTHRHPTSPVRLATPFTHGSRNAIVAISCKTACFHKDSGGSAPDYVGSTYGLNITEAQYSFICCAATFENLEFHVPS